MRPRSLVPYKVIFSSLAPGLTIMSKVKGYAG